MASARLSLTLPRGLAEPDSPKATGFWAAWDNALLMHKNGHPEALRAAVLRVPVVSLAPVTLGFLGYLVPYIRR